MLNLNASLFGQLVVVAAVAVTLVSITYGVVIVFKLIATCTKLNRYIADAQQQANVQPSIHVADPVDVALGNERILSGDGRGGDHVPYNFRAVNEPHTAPLNLRPDIQSNGATPQMSAARGSFYPESASTPRCINCSYLPRAVAGPSTCTGNQPCLALTHYQRFVTTRAAWFALESSSTLRIPPDFSLHPEIKVGDLFMHRSRYGVKFWMWGEGAHGLHWAPIPIGYVRPGDAKRLIVTPKKNEPSWVSEDWFWKTMRYWRP